MKNARVFLAGCMMVALLFSSVNTEAKNNYSNKVVKSEDKAKAGVANNFLPSLGVEDVPEFPSQRVPGFLEKYTPEQLNKLMGLWPDRTEEKAAAKAKVESPEEPVVPVTGSGKYSPEQLVNILGLSF